MNVHTSRLRCVYVTLYLAIGFYIFWCHRCVSTQYVLTRVYVRVFGEPRAPKHGRTHTCTRTHYERMETIHRCGPTVVGAQAFYGASAFNANIGAWNTAAVTTLSAVFALFGRCA
jgi:surface protein